MPSRKYTREVLELLVRNADSFSDVMRALGLPKNGGNHRLITARIRNAGLDTSHFRISDAARSRLEWPPCPAKQSRTPSRGTHPLPEYCELRLATVERAHHEMKRRIEELAIDTSHFRGAGWSRGETMHTHPSVARVAAKRAIPDELVFIANSTYLSGTGVTRRLLARGWPYQCTWCGVTEWRGKALILHLDHINGINNDHRIENLRFLCPNCHSQTETYSNRRR